LGDEDDSRLMMPPHEGVNLKRSRSDDSSAGGWEKPARRQPDRCGAGDFRGGIHLRRRVDAAPAL